MIALAANCAFRKQCACPEKPSLYVVTLLEITLLVCGILMLQKVGPFASLGQGFGISITMAGGILFVLDGAIILQKLVARRTRQERLKNMDDVTLQGIVPQPVSGQTYYQVNLKPLFPSTQDSKAHLYRVYVASEVTADKLEDLTFIQYVLVFSQPQDFTINNVRIKDNKGQDIQWSKVISDINNNLSSIVSL